MGIKYLTNIWVYTLLYFVYYQDFVNIFMIIIIFTINSLKNVINLLIIEGFSLVTEINIPITKMCEGFLILIKLLLRDGKIVFYITNEG